MDENLPMYYIVIFFVFLWNIFYILKILKINAYLFDTMYRISTISEIVRQGVDSMAQWLERWISTPAIRVRMQSVYQEH